MPDSYSSIGEAIGAAMAHNIRLAARFEPPSSDPSRQVKHLPSPSADPYSVPGMIARLTEDATPHDVAGILEEINGALVGALPQLSELVAAAADWTRLRLTFDEPHREPVFETWSRLAAARGLLRDVEENLQAAQDLVTAIPGELRDPRCLDHIPALRTHELLHDVLDHGAAPDDKPPSAPDQHSAARSSSPHAGAHRTAPSAAAPAGPPTPPPASPPRSR